MVYKFFHAIGVPDLKNLFLSRSGKAFVRSKNSLSLVLLLGLLPQFIFAQNKNTGSNISSADASSILAHHNEVRNEVGVGPLKWSNDLAAYAQRWADYLAQSNRCNIRHRKTKESEGKYYGENIFWGSDANAYKIVDASYSWYEEKKDYQFSVFNNDRGPVIGHYTQMVWRNTTEMGAGAAVCPDGGIIVVANYNPAGNFIGEYPY